MIYILFISISLVSYLVQRSLQSKYKKYSQVPLVYGMSGADVATKMLQDSGVGDVKVTATRGTLTDFFNPQNKTVNLSEGVFGTNSVMAAAVAAHECGHAVQHARGYAPLKLRTAMVPVVSFASQWVTWVLLAGIVLVESFPAVLGIGVAMFALTTLFSFVTLPVEIDASSRAVVWLKQSGMVTGEKAEMASDALRAAAYTYVVAALGSLATLVYYAMILLNRRD